MKYWCLFFYLWTPLISFSAIKIQSNDANFRAAIQSDLKRSLLDFSSIPAAGLLTRWIIDNTDFSVLISDDPVELLRRENGSIILSYGLLSSPENLISPISHSNFSKSLENRKVRLRIFSEIVPRALWEQSKKIYSPYVEVLFHELAHAWISWRVLFQDRSKECDGLEREFKINNPSDLYLARKSRLYEAQISDWSTYNREFWFRK